VLLKDKNAVIYGAGGAIGGAVARAFASEGAKVHLAGSTLDSLVEVAEEIRSTGGFDGREQITEMIVDSTMLGQAATLEDVGNVAAFAASDHARTMTATALNISCGAIVD